MLSSLVSRSRPGRLALLAALGCAACSGGSLPADHHLANVSFPLFENLEENCSALLAERAQAGCPISEPTSAIRWATTLDEAFERGAREDKPVMIASFVRENGDPHCDV